MKSTLKRKRRSAKNKEKKRKTRRRYKKRQRRNLFGGASNIPIVFKFSIIGGEHNWDDNIADQSSTRAKNMFIIGAKNHLNDIPYISKENLKFEFTQYDLFVTSSINARNFNDNIAEIRSIVDEKHNGSETKTDFNGQLYVEFDGTFYKFGGISLVD